MNVTNIIAERKIVPVIKIDHIADAVPLAEALCAGNLPIAEVTFRTDAAAESIAAMATNFPQMLVGAGTITNTEQAARALDAGAQFLVSAGFNRKIAEFAINHKISFFPGVCTPTELMLLLEYELPVAKFFPASQFGGLSTIKALSGPFPNLKFMPTGGINAGNILEYLSYNKIIACGGSWMVKSDLIAAGDFNQIREMTQQAVDLVAML